MSAYSYVLLTISAIYMSLQSLKFLHHCILVINSVVCLLNLVWTRNPRKYLRFKRKLTINYLVVSWCTSLRMCSTSCAGCPISKWYTLKASLAIKIDLEVLKKLQYYKRLGHLSFINRKCARIQICISWFYQHLIFQLIKIKLSDYILKSWRSFLVGHLLRHSNYIISS